MQVWRRDPAGALRAHLLARLGRDADARAAYERAAGLTEAPGVRAFLLRRRARLGVASPRRDVAPRWR